LIKKYQFEEFYKKSRQSYFVNKPGKTLSEFAKMGLMRPGLALDLGCGEGRNSIFLAKHGYEVVAIDSSPSAIAKLKKIADEKKLRINTVIGDALELPRKKFDLIVASTILDHIPPKSINTLIQKMKNNLENNGYVCATVLTVQDPGYSRDYSKGVSECSKFVTHYFAKNELLGYFSDFEILLYVERLEKDIGHGQPHINGVARLIAKKF
jgi:tellurite methyltransferase